jgi:hypothetical protein
MKTDAIDLDTLPDDPKVLKALMGKMMQRMNWLEERFRLAQHQRFGANGEAHPGQGELFNVSMRHRVLSLILILSLRPRPSPMNVSRPNAGHYLPSCRVNALCMISLRRIKSARAVMASCIASAKMSHRNLRLSLHKSKLSSMCALSMRAKRVKQVGQRIRLNKRRCQIRLSPKAMRHRAY